MSIFFIKLKDKKDNILLQSILGTYSHLMWVRTEIPKEMIVKIITTPDLLSESKKVLDQLRDEIEFEYVSEPNPLDPERHNG